MTEPFLRERTAPTGRRLPLARFPATAADLPPGAFAFVMATGILSTATLQVGLPALSSSLLVVAVLGYVVLCLLTAWRLIRFWPRLLGDSRLPDRAFGFFTFVAGSEVLGTRLLLAGAPGAGWGLEAAGASAWLLLTYTIPARLATRPPATAAVEVDGNWLIWVVGTQSVAIAAATLARHQPAARPDLGFAATATWGFGVVLYLVLITLILARLVVRGLRPEELTPPYWITMGATAISVFAAARLLAVPSALPVQPAFVRDAALLLWAFGSWWIPLLLVLGVWRHVLCRVPLRYESSLWAMVFPLGMYAAASWSFGQVEGLPPLQDIARFELWAGLVAWLLVLGAMVAAWSSAALGRAGADRP